jgi:paraquat-inducible protein A
MAAGSRKLIGPALIALGMLFPIIFLIPLLKTKILFFTYNEIILLRATYDLFFVNKFIFIVVFVFGILLLATKMILSILRWYRFSIPLAQRWAARLALLSKLSMLDVLLLAIFIIAFKGTGIGAVEIEYGLYLYTALIVGSLLLNIAIMSVSNATYAEHSNSAP